VGPSVTITSVVGDPTAGGIGAIPVVIDSDGGCDDAAALWWALSDPALEGQPVHDLLAATCVADPDQVGGPVVPLAVDVAGGPAWGMTVADLRRHGVPREELAPGFGLWQVALEVDVDRFRAKVRRLLA
jgi:inosine-uridine nucleoside N-ribohydrolase